MTTEPATTTTTEYPHYSVEGRRFVDKDADLAVHFARSLANRMGRRVYVMKTLDNRTPAYVSFTAEPEDEPEDA